MYEALQTHTAFPGVQKKLKIVILIFAELLPPYLQSGQLTITDAEEEPSPPSFIADIRDVEVIILGHAVRLNIIVLEGGGGS